MLIWVWVVISAICAAVAWHCAGEVKKANVKLREWQKQETAFREFYEWGVTTKIVVRDKTNHADARRLTVWGLFETFKNGHAFEGATMLFQNTEFKVYAQGKKEA